jgi:hypothetical protein
LLAALPPNLSSLPRIFILLLLSSLFFGLLHHDLRTEERLIVIEHLVLELLRLDDLLLRP